MAEQRIVRGRVWKYGDDLDSERMAPMYIWHRQKIDEKDIAKYAWIGIDPEFHKKVQPGDIIVAGVNCGYGSSRGGHHVRALKAAQVGAVFAESFSRLFYKSCYNVALPAWKCPGITRFVEEGEELEVNLETGEARNITRGTTMTAPPVKDLWIQTARAGGLLPFIRQRLLERQKAV